jgi:hypothetical protein
MKLKEKVSWLMGTVQRTLFPHLDECLTAPLTEQEKPHSIAFSGNVLSPSQLS